MCCCDGAERSICLYVVITYCWLLSERNMLKLTKCTCTTFYINVIIDDDCLFSLMRTLGILYVLIYVSSHSGQIVQNLL